MSSAKKDVLIQYFPENFFDCKVNEIFVQEIMATVLNETNWRKGDPNKQEPDYLCENIPFEITLVTDRNKKNDNFIKQIKTGKYSTKDMEADIIDYLFQSISAKKKKSYSVNGVHLCLLWICETDTWVADAYGSVFSDIYNHRIKQNINKIKQQFIDSRMFANVFIIFPDSSISWWVWDVLSDIKNQVQLSDDQLYSGKYPFVMSKKIYDEYKISEKMKTNVN